MSYSPKDIMAAACEAIEGLAQGWVRVIKADTTDEVKCEKANEDGASERIDDDQVEESTPDSEALQQETPQCPTPTTTDACSISAANCEQILKELGARIQLLEDTIRAKDIQIVEAGKEYAQMTVAEAMQLAMAKKEPLPPDWQVRWSRSKRKVSFHHRSLKIMKWDRPTVESVKEIAAVCAAATANQ